MANKKINQLVSKTAILSTDLFGIGDATTGQLFKKTIAELQAAIGGAVISVNGLVGTVVLDTDDIQELATPTNKYFTDARARAAISLTVTGNSGASTYSSGTGILNVPTYTLAGLGGITASFLSGASGISYNSTTGVISYSGTVYTDASIRALLSGGTGISYNSSTGAISYSGTVYTDSSVRALISLTTTGSSGASTYNNTTGVINVPEYTLAGLGGISLTSLSGGTGITYNNTTGAISYSGTVYTDASVRALISASGAVSYNNTTGVISLTSGNLTEATSSVLTITGGTGAVLGSGTSIQVKQASSTVSGFLSSTDWSTFNGKASALSGTTGYHAKFTSSTTIGNGAIYDDASKIGIGTTSPDYAITISGSTDATSGIRIKNTDGVSSAPRLIIEQANAQKMQMYAYGNGFVFNYTFTDSINFYDGANSVSRLLIKANGNVAIGTTTDVDHKLKVAGIVNSSNGASNSVGGGSAFLLDGSATNGSSLTFLQQGVSKFAIWTYTGSAWGERMAITSSGAFLVGNTLTYGRATISTSTSKTSSSLTADSSALHLTTSETDTPFGLKFFLAGNATSSARFASLQTGTHGIANEGQIVLQEGGGNVLIGTTSNSGEKLYVSGSIRATGSITANSDISLKKNLLKIENALEKVEQINGYTYELKEDDSKRHAGVIAQEIKEVLPEIVNTGNDGLMGVEYGNISALLIEAIKEQQTQIKELKALLNK